MRHGRRSWRVLSVLLGSLPPAFLACGQGEDLTGPGPPTLRITIATSGDATDSDGYTVAIDGQLPRAVGVLDTLLEDDLAPGEHTVDLAGISAGCAVEGGGARSVTTSEGTLTPVDYSVTCSVPDPVPTGTVRVTVTTSGVDVDPDGYEVAIDPAERRPVEVSGETMLETVPVGQRSVRLSGLAGNCSVQGANPRSVEVQAAEEVLLVFAVRCWPPSSGRIAFATQAGLASIIVIGTDGSALGEQFSAESPRAPSWSPDGRFIAFMDGRTTVVWELATGATLFLPDCGLGATSPVWSPDGARLLCLTGGGSEETSLYSIRRNGTSVRPLNAAGQNVTAAWYLDDGSVLYAAEQVGTATVYRVAAGGGEPAPLFDLPGDVFDPLERVIPAGNGSAIAFVRSRSGGAEELYVVDGDGTNLRLVSGGLRVRTLTVPAWSPDGSSLVFATEDEAGEVLRVVRPDGSAFSTVQPPGPLGFSDVIEWSPDGTRLAFVVQHEVNGERGSSIYMARVDGSGIEQLTPFGNRDESPAWGP